MRRAVRAVSGGRNRKAHVPLLRPRLHQPVVRGEADGCELVVGCQHVRRAAAERVEGHHAAADRDTGRILAREHRLVKVEVVVYAKGVDDALPLHLWWEEALAVRRRCPIRRRALDDRTIRASAALTPAAGAGRERHARRLAAEAVRRSGARHARLAAPATGARGDRAGRELPLGTARAVA